MDEYYFRLEYRKATPAQFGIILRIRTGHLEELTGFIHLEETGKTEAGVHYEGDVNTDGNGEPIYKGRNRRHMPDVVGLTLARHAKVEIHKQPKKKMRVTEISMVRAAKILEKLDELRDAEAYIAYS
jgi:hypothetical protein